MYAGGGDVNEGLESIGLPGALAGSFIDADLDVWPELWPALELFSALCTQWRVGMGGATGLDYTALPVVMDMLEIAPEDRRERFEEVRVMERAALEVMSEKAKVKG